MRYLIWILAGTYTDVSFSLYVTYDYQSAVSTVFCPCAISRAYLEVGCERPVTNLQERVVENWLTCNALEM